jgi:hypothetical protein
MSNLVHIDVVDRLKQAADATVAANPALVKALLAGGAGLLGGGAIGAHLMHKHDEEARQRARNVGFGAGVATGFAGPQIIDALHSVMHRGDQ